MLYHSLEKGMSMPEPKPGYGQEKANEILTQVRTLLGLNCTNTQIESALHVLAAYTSFNEELGVLLPDIKKEVHNLLGEYRTRHLVPNQQAGGGRKLVRKEDLARLQSIDFKSFVFNRHSIRSFTDENIPIELITEAVLIAQKSPSVCNRQSSRVHVFKNGENAKEILKLQNGNKGFGHTANKILVVTSNLSSFLAVGERNQTWVDGGLFAMTLIYALHSLGLGTCCLNWSKEMEDDLALRKIADIPEQENIIMLIAVGCLPDELYIPWSYRSPIEEIISYH